MYYIWDTFGLTFYKFLNKWLHEYWTKTEYWKKIEVFAFVHGYYDMVINKTFTQKDYCNIFVCQLIQIANILIINCPQ